MAENLNTYSLTKKRVKSLFVIALIAILGGSLIAATLNAIAVKHVVLDVLIAIIILSSLFVGLYALARIITLRLSTDLVCEKCGSPSFKRGLFPIDVNSRGMYRGFKDICPNCGNDNRVKLHDP